jgi:hypothetical protein
VGKGQLTIFVIIGLILLILTSIFFINVNKNKTNTNDLNNNLEVDFIETYVKECIELVSLKSIENKGLKSEIELKQYVEMYLPQCLDEFKLFIEQGYEIDYKEQEINIEIDNEIITFDLNLNIDIKKDNSQKTLNEFNYEINRIDGLNTDSGILKQGVLFKSTDENLEIEIKKDTKVTDENGNPIDSITIDLMDKHFDELSNSVAMGNIVYQGLPSGARFDPPLEMTIKTKKGNLLNGYNPSDLKIGYYDKKSDIWFTYKSLDFYEDENYYYYTSLIDHFTPIAIVACGSSEVSTYAMPLNYIYKHPIEPVDIGWVDNFQDEPYFGNFIQDIGKGKHLVPELMGIAECNVEENMDYYAKYAVDRDVLDLEESGAPIWENEKYKTYLCTQNGLLRDWDNDDNPEKSNINHYDFAIWKDEYDNGNPDNLIYSTNWQGDDNKIQNIENGLDKNQLIEFCYNSCKTKIEQGLKYYFTGEKKTTGNPKFIKNINPLDEKYQFNLYEFKLNNEEEVSLISGDGLIDGAILKCEYDTSKDLSEDTVTCIDEDIANIDDFEEGVERLEVILPKHETTYSLKGSISNKYNVNNIASTPMTYGYSNLGMFDYIEGPQGEGKFSFELLEKGGTCIDDIGMSLFLEDPEGRFVEEFSEENNYYFFKTKYDSSSNFENWWFLNKDVDKNDLFPGSKLVSGINYVTTLGYDRTTYDETPEAYADGTLYLKGKGLKGFSQCDVTVQDRIDYYEGCDGDGKAGWVVESADPIEYNCLKEYENKEESLCDVHFETQGCTIYTYSIIESEALIGPKGHERLFNPNGGFCLDDKRICPDKLSSNDYGCYCGNNRYITELKAKYCCAGEYYTDNNLPEDITCWEPVESHIDKLLSGDKIEDVYCEIHSVSTIKIDNKCYICEIREEDEVSKFYEIEDEECGCNAEQENDKYNFGDICVECISDVSNNYKWETCSEEDFCPGEINTCYVNDNNNYMIIDKSSKPGINGECSYLYRQKTSLDSHDILSNSFEISTAESMFTQPRTCEVFCEGVGKCILENNGGSANKIESLISYDSNKLSCLYKKITYIIKENTPYYTYLSSYSLDEEFSECPELTSINEVCDISLKDKCFLNEKFNEIYVINSIDLDYYGNCEYITLPNINYDPYYTRDVYKGTFNPDIKNCNEADISICYGEIGDCFEDYSDNSFRIDSISLNNDGNGELCNYEISKGISSNSFIFDGEFGNTETHSYFQKENCEELGFEEIRSFEEILPGSNNCLGKANTCYYYDGGKMIFNMISSTVNEGESCKYTYQYSQQEDYQTLIPTTIENQEIQNGDAEIYFGIELTQDIATQLEIEVPSFCGSGNGENGQNGQEGIYKFGYINHERHIWDGEKFISPSIGVVNNWDIYYFFNGNNWIKTSKKVWIKDLKRDDCDYFKYNILGYEEGHVLPNLGCKYVSQMYGFELIKCDETTIDLPECVYDETYGYFFRVVDYSACPYLYTYNGESYHFDNTIITNHNGKSTDSIQYDEITDYTNPVKIEIREVEPEISYLDLIRLKVTDTNNQNNKEKITYLDVRYSSRDLNKILTIDENYLITRQGDVVEIIFDELPILEEGSVREVGVIAKGYYDRLD